MATLQQQPATICAVWHKMQFGEIDHWYTADGWSACSIAEVWESHMSRKDRRKYRLCVKGNQFRVVVNRAYVERRVRAMWSVIGALAFVAVFTLLCGLFGAEWLS